MAWDPQKRCAREPLPGEAVRWTQELTVSFFKQAGAVRVNRLILYARSVDRAGIFVPWFLNVRTVVRWLRKRGDV
jgi:hypothetical protein